MNTLIKIPAKNRGRGIHATGEDREAFVTGGFHQRMIRTACSSAITAMRICTVIKNISPSTPAQRSGSGSGEQTMQPSAELLPERLQASGALQGLQP